MVTLKFFPIFLVCILAAGESALLQNENTVSQVINISNQQIETENQKRQNEITEISLNMKRLGCFWGGCPMYDLTIQPDGKVIFEGEKYTKKIGKAESNLEKEKIKELITEIEKAKFFSLDNSYDYESKNCPISMSDHPSIIIAIKLNGREKTINHDLGCWLDSPITTDSNGAKVLKENWTQTIFPQELYNLENKIDEIVETKRWIGEIK